MQRTQAEQNVWKLQGLNGNVMSKANQANYCLRHGRPLQLPDGGIQVVNLLGGKVAGRKAVNDGVAVGQHFGQTLVGSLGYGVPMDGVAQQVTGLGAPLNIRAGVGQRTDSGLGVRSSQQAHEGSESRYEGANSGDQVQRHVPVSTIANVYGLFIVRKFWKRAW